MLRWLSNRGYRYDTGARLVRLDEPRGLAPVIPLFGGAAAPPPAAVPTPRTPVDEPRRPVTFSEEYWADDEDDADEADAAPAGAATTSRSIAMRCVRRAATSLVRSLGRRGLSITEARARLRTRRADRRRGDRRSSDEFIDRGWLDDAVLAEQLVHSATDRKRHGHPGDAPAAREARHLARRHRRGARRAARRRRRARTRVRPQQGAVAAPLDDETAMRRLMGSSRAAASAGRSRARPHARRSPTSGAARADPGVAFR